MRAPWDPPEESGKTTSEVPTEAKAAPWEKPVQAQAAPWEKPADTTPKPDELGRYDANKQGKSEDKLPPEEQAQIEREYGISSEMGNIEYAGRLGKRALKEAGIGLEQSWGGLKRFGNDILGLDNSDNQKNLDHLDAVSKTLGSPESHAARIVEGAVSSIIQQVPLIAGGFATAAAAPVVGVAALAGEAAIGATVLTGMFMQSFGQTYDDSRREGLDLKDSTIRSGAFGLLEVVGEKFGLGAEIKAIKASAKGVPTKELAGYFAKALAKEVPGEELTYAGQFAVDKGYGMNPEAGLQEFFDGALDTLAGTVVQGGMMMGAGAGVNKGVRTLHEHLSNKQERADIKETYKKDLAARGETPTPEQLNTLVDNHLKAREEIAAEETKGEENAGTRTDTGTTESSIPISEQEGSGEPAGGTAASTTVGVGGDTGPAVTSSVGEGTQQTALIPISSQAASEANKLFNTKKTENPDGTIAYGLPTPAVNKQIQAYTLGAIDASHGLNNPELAAKFKGKAKQAYEAGYAYAQNLATSKTEETAPWEKPEEKQAIQEEIPTDQEMQDAGFTQYEIAQLKKNPWPERYRQIKQGYRMAAGQFRQITQEDVDQVKQSNVTKQKIKAEKKAQLDAAFAKDPRDGVPQILGSDWYQKWGSQQTDAEYQKHAYETLERQYGSIDSGVAMLERRLAAAKNEQTIAPSATPEEIATHPVAQEFDALAAQRQMALDEGDTVGAKELLQQMGKIRKDLPEGHPSYVAPIIARPKLTKAERKAQAKAAEDKTRLDNTSPRIGPEDIEFWNPVHPEVDNAIRNNDIQGVLKALKSKGSKFISAFASRLMQLGLKTQIGFDQLNRLETNELAKVKGQQDRILNWLALAYPAIYEKHFNIDNMTQYANPITALGNALIYLQEEGFGKGIDIHAISEDLKDVISVYKARKSSLTASGTYFVKQDAINLNSQKGGNTNHTVVHEISHAGTHWAIDNPTLLNEKQKKALDNLTALYRLAKRKGNQARYGYTNLHEFVAEAFSNPAFQKELREMKVSRESDQTVWSKFIQAVAQIFGVDNVLFHTLANADVLLSANRGSAVGESVLFAPEESTDEMPTISHGLKGWIVNPGEREGSTFAGVFKRLVKGRLKWDDVNKENVKDFFTNINETSRRYYLGAFTLDQLTDMAGELTPQFKAYVRESDAMIATRSRIMHEGDKPIVAWGELLKKNPVKAEQLSHMMLQATLAKVDPDSTGRGHDATALAANPELQKAWADMVSGPDGDTALKIYKEVRTFYERRMDEYLNILEKRLIDRETAKGTDAKDIAKLVQLQRNSMNENIIQPYFPIKRFGEYWLQVDKGKKKTFMQFESAAARNAALKSLKQHLIKTQGRTAEDLANSIFTGEGFTELTKASLSDVTHLTRLKDRIDEATAKVAADPQARGDELNTLSDIMKDSLDQYMLEIAPNESIKKMFMHRNNIQGASADMLRAFSESRYRIAYQRARFEHMPQLFYAVDAARLNARAMPHSKEASFSKALVHELELNLKTAMLEPIKQAWWSRAATQFGFLHFLTSPASAVVNLMALPAIYIPFAKARYGLKPITAALNKYRQMLGGTGYKSATTGQYEFLSLARSKELAETFVLDKQGNKIFTEQVDPDTGEVTKVPLTFMDAYNQGIELGAIDVTATHTQAGLGDMPSKDYTGLKQKFMYYASLPFHNTEKLNRELAYMSTFELAYNKHLETKSPTKAFEMANQDARDLVQKTMFNYNSANKPRYFRGNLVSIVSQFKMYPQQMTVLMASTFHNSLERSVADERAAYAKSVESDPRKDELIAAKNAEIDRAKKEAFESFWGMMLMTFITAGLSGLPIYFIATGIMSAFNAAFGDDDKPFDADNWFKNWCNRTFGGFIGDSLSRGVLSQVTGANFADRMNTNLTDMWFPSTKQSKDEVQALQNTMTALMGPTVGAALGYAEALKRFNDGHYERAAEAMLPAGIKNIFVGTRYLVEGKALTLKGDTLDDNVPARDALKQMFGFSPEDTAQKQKAAMAMKNEDIQILARKTDLENAFFMSVDGHDADMRKRVIKKIIKFNGANPEYAIDADAIYTSVEKRYTQRAMANITGGVNITPKAMARLTPMLDYSKD